MFHCNWLFTGAPLPPLCRWLPKWGEEKCSQLGEGELLALTTNTHTQMAAFYSYTYSSRAQCKVGMWFLCEENSPTCTHTMFVGEKTRWYTDFFWARWLKLAEIEQKILRCEDHIRRTRWIVYLTYVLYSEQCSTYVVCSTPRASQVKRSVKRNFNAVFGPVQTSFWFYI
jgi:hypothetical protein